MIISCYNCENELQIESAGVFSCPYCGVELHIEAEVEPAQIPVRKRNKINRRGGGRPRQRGEENERSTGRRKKKAGPPQTGLVSAWLWLYTVVFVIGAFFAGYSLTNVTHVQTGEKSGYTMGILFGCFIGLFAVAFAATAIGLSKRKEWAWNFALRFMVLNMFSPFFPIGIMGINRLNHKDTLDAFGIEIEEEDEIPSPRRRRR